MVQGNLSPLRGDGTRIHACSKFGCAGNFVVEARRNKYRKPEEPEFEIRTGEAARRRSLAESEPRREDRQGCGRRNFAAGGRHQ
jgi:hypothetical protein